MTRLVDGKADGERNQIYLIVASYVNLGDASEIYEE